MTARSASVAALLATCAASAALLLAATPSSADPLGGALAVEPAQGKDDWGAIWLVSSAPCPEPSTHYKVRITGANFPQDSNAIGNQTLANLGPAAGGKGLAIPLWGSWDTVARANNAQVPLDGTAKISLLCINHFGTKVYAEMTGEVRFARVAGGPSTYEQVGGPTLVSGEARTPAQLAAKELAASAAAAATPVPIAGVDPATAVPGAAASPPSSAAGAQTAAPAEPPAAEPPASQGASAGAGSAETVVTASESSSHRGADMPVAIGAGIVAVAAGTGAFLYLRKRPAARI
jgi:hypothetical protein